MTTIKRRFSLLGYKMRWLIISPKSRLLIICAAFGGAVLDSVVHHAIPAKRTSA
uniref:Uncharacterized protein n=1 Tax=Siphoviridae sp. ctg0K17 TaxID=2825600 RepID=A0A8S5PX78_9CAUD|nr:MAG TPA: hypothetical protein [Siphoviridae sp. ctg0K17]